MKGREMARLHSVLDMNVSAYEIMDLVGVDESNVMDCIDEAYARAVGTNPSAPPIPSGITAEVATKLVAALFCICWQQSYEEVMDIAYEMCSALPMAKGVRLSIE